jgi:predicted dehydrogenase
LYVALEPFRSIEFVDLAAARGIGVFHKAPCARSVDEASQLARRFADGRCPLVVSRRWQFDPAYALLGCLSETAGDVYAATARVQTADAPVGWRGDSARAGGGVLLNGAYEVVDMLIRLLGSPETVYARCGLAGSPGSLRKYDTEDVAVMSLDFGSDRVAGLTAVRGETEPSWAVALMGTESTVEIRPDGMTITTRGGSPAEHYTAQSANPVAHAISAFGSSLLSGARRYESTISEHVATLAVIQAAYLSARTGAPETPARFAD